MRRLKWLVVAAIAGVVGQITIYVLENGWPRPRGGLVPVIGLSVEEASGVVPAFHFVLGIAISLLGRIGALRIWFGATLVPIVWCITDAVYDSLVRGVVSHTLIPFEILWMMTLTSPAFLGAVLAEWFDRRRSRRRAFRDGNQVSR